MKKKTLTAIITAALVLTTALTSLIIIGRKSNVNTNKKINGLNEELSEIMYLGSLAPSSHNIQCWLIELYPEEGMLTVSVDPERKLDVVDPHSREQFLSLGCYIRTLEEAFLAYGYNVSYGFDENDNNVTLTYDKLSETVNEESVNRILKRHTDKRPFDGKETSENEILEKLCNTAGISYYSFPSKEFAIIKKSTLEAYVAQAYNVEVAAELSTWLRLSNKETSEKKDGLPAEQLGISGFKKSLYYLFTNHESAKGESFAKQGIDNTVKQLDNALGFVVVSSGNSPKELVECGIKTTDLWLDLTDNNIAVQPMSYALEEETYKHTVTDHLHEAETPQMILRVGCVNKYGKNAAIRRDLTDYISVH